MSSKEQRRCFSKPWRHSDNMWQCVRMALTCSKDIQKCLEHQYLDLFYGVIKGSLQRIWDRQVKKY